MVPDDIKEKIDRGEWGFIDKVLKGGFGYGKFCVPDEMPHIILSIVFPPSFYNMELPSRNIYSLGNYKKIYDLFNINIIILLSRFNLRCK